MVFSCIRRSIKSRCSVSSGFLLKIDINLKLSDVARPRFAYIGQTSYILPVMTHHHSIHLPLIKVCGVTREQDVPPLAAAGVTTVGLNFVPHSPRCVGNELARQLLARSSECGLTSVAVVMNPSIDELSRLLGELSFDYVQLHGAEPPELLDQLDWSGLHRPSGIIKAISWSGREEEGLLAEAWRTHRGSANSSPLVAFLVDAYAPEQGGGTGRVARWDLLTPRPAVLSGVPLILAGGIIPDNVAAAIAAVGPAGIDTASGVEASPGIKSEALVAGFGRAASEAFQQLAAKRCCSSTSQPPAKE